MDDMLKKLRHRTPSLLGMKQLTKFAVLLPLVEQNGELHILFEVRSSQLRRQPGEICFPGGKVDASDKNEQEAAIRETCEELGVDSTAIYNVFPLDYIVSPFGMVIYPFAARLADPHLIKPNRAEVAEVFIVPLSFFQETKPEIYHVHFQPQPDPDFPFDKIPNGKNYRWRPRQMDEYFYYYGDKVIWGLTARIVHHFIQLIFQNNQV
ncbi:NUDIX hydrolase [Anoxybacteroides tepidamans]|uniref:NUDIX hydrolase n=1 Tax=Anoxybacteroides tepidamans TaxID=265948 RepID=UPI0004856820|nr:CoA pyrophosphatase [Anoxybacillus tepidamans]